MMPMTMKTTPPARRAPRLAALAAALSLCACAGTGIKPEALNAGPLPAEPATVQSQQDWLGRLPFADRQDFEDAERGHIAGPAVVIGQPYPVRAQSQFVKHSERETARAAGLQLAGFARDGQLNLYAPEVLA